MLRRLHFHLASIPCSHVKDSWKDPLAKHPNTSPRTPLKSHKSRRPLVHHLIPLYYTLPKPGAKNPRPKHQAVAPNGQMLPLYDKSMLVRVLLTFNASASACGQLGWQTMSNMRTYNAICDNIQPCPLQHLWNQQTAEAKTREIWGNQGELKLQRCRYFRLLVGNIDHFLPNFENAPPIPLPSCFHPMFPCEGLLETSTGLTPEHQSTNTAEVSQVSKTTGYTTWFHYITPFQNLEPQALVACTTPWLLPRQCHCMTSQCSSEFCCLLMLWQGPVDKKDGKPCETWELTMQFATI